MSAPEMYPGALSDAHSGRKMQSHNDKLVHAIELQNAGKIDEATVLFREILAADPNNAAALYSHGVISLNKGLAEEAFRLSDHGVKVAPLFAPMHFVHGASLLALGKKEEALRSYDAALQIQPDYTEVLQNSGVLLREMLRHREALERFNKILTLNPNNASALANCGIVLTEFKQSEQAIAMFKRLLALKPDYDYGLGLLLYEQLHVCDWSMLAPLSKQIVEGVRAGKRSCKTLALMAVTDSASDHYIAAKTFASHFFPKASKSLWKGERYKHDKIRIAYVSPDLREHPVGHLMAGIFERHDKSRFETIAISLGIDDQSRLRARMLNAFDHFIDARQMGSRQIAQLMRDMEVDIAIDLAGYTVDSRTEAFAYRPAPVQVNYLGYPGTLGTDYYDYILADRFIIPEENQQYFTEKVVYLPDAYLPTDAGVKISERTPKRAECGLPDEGIVFCSFSHDYKISPPMFDSWMNILRRVPGSVLWLMSRGEMAQVNLRKEAQARDVNPERLIFAGRVPMVEDHMARYRQADLFLDTHPYNAHTTAADAMMAGLPVLTYMGSSFPSRVAASLVMANGIPEMVTHSLQEYEDTAVRLAAAPAELKELKARVAANRHTHALFDTDSFCRNMEAAYIAMWRSAQLGDAKDALSSQTQKALPQS
jgi:protein O-GlcNAc transferase